MPEPTHGTGSGGVAGGTDLLTRDEAETDLTTDKGWNALVWNDPVNTMGYVTAMFIRILEITPEKAEALMLTVHTEGKAMVLHGTYSEAETVMVKFQAANLYSSMERAS